MHNFFTLFRVFCQDPLFYLSYYFLEYINDTRTTKVDVRQGAYLLRKHNYTESMITQKAQLNRKPNYKQNTIKQKAQLHIKHNYYTESTIIQGAQLHRRYSMNPLYHSQEHGHVKYTNTRHKVCPRNSYLCS